MANSKNTDIAILRKRRADYQRKWAHGKGVVPVKGTFFKCCDCSQTFPRVDVKQKRCNSCRVIYGREQSRQRRLRVGHVPIGTKFNCKNCTIEIEKKFKRHFYCVECTKLSEVSMLPHQIEATRKRALMFQRRKRKIPKWSIAARMSAGIRSSLLDGKKGRHWETLVDYTITDLMRHLERQFLKGMSWDNRGEWHIDHRRPLASYQFTSADDHDFKAAWALSNLQPLWAADNIRKSAKLLHLV